MEFNLSVLLISNQPALVDQIRAVMAELGQDMDVLHSMDAFEDEFSTHVHLCLLDATESSEAAFELTGPVCGKCTLWRAWCASPIPIACPSGCKHGKAVPIW